MLITGGLDSDYNSLSSVELYGEEFQCKMNTSMKMKRYGHASAGDGTVCGGYGSDDSLTTCETMDTTGVWSISHTLNQKREDSVMWRTRLLGGYYSRTTTEVLQDDGGSENSFTLQHVTRYVDMCL